MRKDHDRQTTTDPRSRVKCHSDACESYTSTETTNRGYLHHIEMLRPSSSKTRRPTDNHTHIFAVQLPRTRDSLAHCGASRKQLRNERKPPTISLPIDKRVSATLPKPQRCIDVMAIVVGHQQSLLTRNKRNLDVSQSELRGDRPKLRFFFPLLKAHAYAKS